MRSASVLLVALVVTACAPTTSRRVAPQPMSRAFVSAEDLSRFPGGWSAFEALSRLRPEFLKPVPGGYANGQVLTPTVILDGIHRGGIEMLRTLRLGEVVSVRYYRSLDATTRFGPQHSGAVIEVRLRGSGW